MRQFDAEPLWWESISHDWGWLRRSYFVATWPLWYAWARLRMWLFIAQILKDALYIDEFIDEAYAEYAESVGKSSVEGMSDNEKQQALLSWTLKQGEGG